MARNAPKDRVKAEVEAQAAACATLARSMRAHAGSLGITKRSERKLIDGWADILDSIADELTAAVNHKDAPGLGRCWKLALWATSPLLGLAGHVADGLAISDHFTGNETATTIAQEIHDRGETNMTIILNWNPTAAESKTVTGTVNVTEDDDTIAGSVEFAAPGPAQPSGDEAEVDPGKVPDRPFRSGKANQKGPDEPEGPLWTTFQVIGSLLRDLRLGMDLSLEEVSVALGVSQNRVLQVENGQVAVPNTLAAYADQLISTHDRTMPETLTDEVQALQDELRRLKPF